MIELPVWLAVGIAICVLIFLVNARRYGRVEGFRFCLNTIIVVADLYSRGDRRPLAPHETDVAQTLGAVVEDIVKGYAAAQADEAVGRR